MELITKKIALTPTHRELHVFFPQYTLRSAIKKQKQKIGLSPILLYLHCSYATHCIVLPAGRRYDGARLVEGHILSISIVLFNF